MACWTVFEQNSAEESTAVHRMLCGVRNDAVSLFSSTESLSPDHSSEREYVQGSPKSDRDHWVNSPKISSWIG